MLAGNRSARQVGAGSDGEVVMDAAEAKGGKGLDNEDNEYEPTENAVCAFVDNSPTREAIREAGSPFQEGLKKREKKEPRQVGHPPLSS